MKFTWLGQAGLLFEKGNTKIIIDPYLSNSVEKINPENYRRVAIDESFFDVNPDVMIFTHDHLDHFDPETAEKFLCKEQKPILVLSPSSVWQKAREYKGEHNYVLFNSVTEWTEGNFLFKAVFAEHSDPCAIGVIIEDLVENKTYYVTGDTLYSERIFSSLPKSVDYLFLPINGTGNNMNICDAERFAKRVGASFVIPIHYGMFDNLNPDVMKVKGLRILEIYKKTTL